MKRFISLLLALLMLISTVSIACAEEIGEENIGILIDGDEELAEINAKGCNHVWTEWVEEARLTGFTLDPDQDCKFTHVDCSRCCTKCALIQYKSDTHYEKHVWIGVVINKVPYKQCSVCGVKKQIQ